MSDEQLPADPATPAPTATPGDTVTRSVDLQASPEAVWEALADPDHRTSWLDDEDAAQRTLRIDRAEPGRSLTWTWWRPDDEAGASRVHVELTPLTDGTTRVAVTERLLTPPGHAPRSTLRAAAGAASTTATAGAQAGAARSAVWDHRLLGLELLVLAAGALVG
jgi:uncharacterized protein YndB with AHSA1/START domain